MLFFTGFKFSRHTFFFAAYGNYGGHGTHLRICLLSVLLNRGKRSSGTASCACAAPEIHLSSPGCVRTSFIFFCLLLIVKHRVRTRLGRCVHPGTHSFPRRIDPPPSPPPLDHESAASETTKLPLIRREISSIFFRSSLQMLHDVRASSSGRTRPPRGPSRAKEDWRAFAAARAPRSGASGTLPSYPYIPSKRNQLNGHPPNIDALFLSRQA